MISGVIVESRDDRVLLHAVRKTVNSFDRMRGLLGSPEPTADEGLLITPCSSIHMFFMRYPLDIVFLDSRGIVVALRRMLQPWRMASCRGAKAVLEMRAGQIDRLHITLGSSLRWQ